MILLSSFVHFLAHFDRMGGCSDIRVALSWLVLLGSGYNADSAGTTEHWLGLQERDYNVGSRDFLDLAFPLSPG